MSAFRSRLLIVALVVSVAVNLLVVGGLIGRTLNDGPAASMPPHLGWLIRDSKPDVREMLRERLRATAPQMRELRGNVRRVQRAFNQLASEDPLDEDAIEAALARIRTSNLEFQEAMHGQMTDIIRELDGEDRRKAIRYLQARTRVDDRRGWHGGPRGRDRDRAREWRAEGPRDTEQSDPTP